MCFSRDGLIETPREKWVVCRLNCVKLGILFGTFRFRGDDVDKWTSCCGTLVLSGFKALKIYFKVEGYIFNLERPCRAQNMFRSGGLPRLVIIAGTLMFLKRGGQTCEVVRGQGNDRGG